MLTRIRGAVAHARRSAAVGRFFRHHFANADELLAAYHARSTCEQAVHRDGSVIRHPARAGLPLTLVEIWHDEVYTGSFYQPRPGDVIVDAGANVGLFSLWAARLCQAARVLAFEPFAENFALLTANLASAKATGVEAFPAGLTASSGTASMADGGHRSLDHRLVVGGDGPTIPTHSFADVLARAGGRVSLFKCDIEGSEADLLGAADDAHLAAVERFAIEFHDNLRPGTLALLQRRLGGRFDLRVVRVGSDEYGMLYATRRG